MVQDAQRSRNSGHTLLASHRSIGRVPHAVLGNMGINRRFGVPDHRRPANGIIFGPGGKILLEGHHPSMKIGQDTSEILDIELRSDIGANRAEFIPLSKHLLEDKFCYYHTPMAYEFEVRLDGQSMESDPADQSIAQLHGVANRLLGATTLRHAPFLLVVLDGRYHCISAASRKLAPKRGKNGDALSGLDRVQKIPLHNASEDADRWVHWRFEVCWAYKGDLGWWRLFKDKELVAEDIGPNCYNELRGAPYLQFGVYRLGRGMFVPQNPLPSHKRSYRNVRIGLL